MNWLANNHLLVFILLLVYFALHSIMAADRVKAWCSSRLGSAFRYYRLIYNVLATVLLLVLLRWMSDWPTEYLFRPTASMTAVAFLLLLLSAWLSIGSLLQYDLAEFAGIRQLTQKDATPQTSRLNTSGFNAIVRHPLYLGTIFLLLGLFLLFPKMQALLLLVSVLVYLPFGIYWEEKKLRREFGQAYLDYAERVKALIPGVW